MEDSEKEAVEGHEDLQEEEVWDINVNAREGANSNDVSSSSFAWLQLGEESSPPRRHQASAPVKILKKRHNYDSGVDAVHIYEDKDEKGGMAPPHEVLARRLARTRIASHSMCEGVGRTLKGRDLSKTRNAILTKTGFIE